MTSVQQYHAVYTLTQNQTLQSGSRNVPFFSPDLGRGATGESTARTQSQRDGFSWSRDAEDASHVHDVNQDTTSRSYSTFGCQRHGDKTLNYSMSRFKRLESRFLLPLTQPRHVTYPKVKVQQDPLEEKVSSPEVESTVASPEAWSPVTFYEKASFVFMPVNQLGELVVVNFHVL
ncbi:hypothetical protein BgiBS90_001004 [Biomphalaria glabrata]|nr:hypothetical protein BgiBS90_001004 [Biomphalaria glabrata]